MIRKVSILLICCCCYTFVKAQDPFLSQFYSSAQFLSPASVGSGGYDSRTQSNYRSQMLAGNNLYRTIVVGWDTRIKNKQEEVKNYLGIGAQVISDQVMQGILQTNYATINAAYHIFLDESLNNNLAVGLGVTASQATFKLDQLKFADQYSYGAFIPGSTSLSLQNIKNTSKVSVNTGILYTTHSETNFVQLSANAFFYTKPELSNISQEATNTLKSVVFFNTEHVFFDRKTFMFHASYNSRNKIEQYLVGGAMGLPFGNDYTEVNRFYVGCYYRLNDAIIPNINLLMNKYRLGLSYDIYSGGFSGANLKPSSFEISFSAGLGKKRGDNLRTIFD